MLLPAWIIEKVAEIDREIEDLLRKQDEDRPRLELPIESEPEDEEVVIPRRRESNTYWL